MTLNFGSGRAGCAHFARRREAGWVFQPTHLFFCRSRALCRYETPEAAAPLRTLNVESKHLNLHKSRGEKQDGVWGAHFSRGMCRQGILASLPAPACATVQRCGVAVTSSGRASPRVPCLRGSGRVAVAPVGVCGPTAACRERGSFASGRAELGGERCEGHWKSLAGSSKWGDPVGRVTGTSTALPWPWGSAGCPGHAWQERGCRRMTSV